MSKKESLSFVRRLCSIALAVVATACMVLGVLIVTTGQAFSRKTIQKTLNRVNLQAEYGEATAHIVNVAIKHFTDGAYTENLYLTADNLMDYVDEKELNTFLVNKFTEFSSTFTTNSVVEMHAEEFVPLFSGICAHVQEETGVAVTEEQVIKEMTAIMRSTALKSNTTRIVTPAVGIILIVLAAGALVGTFAVSWPKMIRGSIWMVISLVISSLLVRLTSGVVLGWLNTGFIAEQIGKSLVSVWILNVKGLVRTNAGCILLGTIPPGLLIVAYCIDRRLVAHWESMRGKK